MDIQNIHQAEPFITVDGSEIRELLAYRNSSIGEPKVSRKPDCRRSRDDSPQSPAYGRDLLHPRGHGRDDYRPRTRAVRPGDAIAIPPGAVHTIRNTAHDVEVSLLLRARL